MVCEMYKIKTYFAFISLIGFRVASFDYAILKSGVVLPDVNNELCESSFPNTLINQ